MKTETFLQYREIISGIMALDLTELPFSLQDGSYLIEYEFMNTNYTLSIEFHKDYNLVHTNLFEDILGSVYDESEFVINFISFGNFVKNLCQMLEQYDLL
ncbi:unnamed protein product [marine sediment metagenome]|uniref:Uncharacterized protein n=1 Tax=marine sediment metagenome TaxID=412755 RepID=X0ZPG0_9ZZZZ